MSIVVQKYGGSSVADVDRLRRVAQRVMATRREGHDVVVVVSAMGDTSDELLAMAKRVSANPERRELDMLLSAGERISMALLSMAIRELGGDAISFTGSQSGIITNDRHVDARIIEVRPFRVQDELARGRIVVVAGYQGVSYKKEVTTLGRGGSDTTAVAMAAALGADWCEICSDVDGVYSADPRVVASARRIPVLSYEETQEMAEAGAKVLNAQAVEFAKERGIAIYARATSSALPGADPSSDGTVSVALRLRISSTFEPACGALPASITFDIHNRDEAVCGVLTTDRDLCFEVDDEEAPVARIDTSVIANNLGDSLEMVLALFRGAGAGVKGEGPDPDVKAFFDSIAIHQEEQSVVVSATLSQRAIQKVMAQPPPIPAPPAPAVPETRKPAPRRGAR